MKPLSSRAGLPPMLLTLVALAALCSAVFREDAGLIDFKFAVYGSPRAVAVHNKSLAVVTDENVLAVYNPYGTTMWRQILTPQQSYGSVAWAQDLIVVGGEYLEGFNATNGSSLFTIDYKPSQVYVTGEYGSVVVDGEYVVERDGKISPGSPGSPEEPAVGLAVSDVTGGETSLAGGLTLIVEPHGVIRLTNSTGDEVWNRDDGLSSAEQAVFLHSAPEQKDSEKALREANYFTTRYFNGSNGFIQPIFKRTLSHIGGFTHYVIKLMLGGGMTELLLAQNPREEYQFNQLLVLRTASGSVYGLNTTEGGSVAWVYHDLDATELTVPGNDGEVAPTTVHVRSLDGNVYILNNEGIVVGLADNAVVQDQASPFENVEVVDNTTLIRSSRFGWEVALPGSVVVGRATRAASDTTAQVAVPLSDHEVLYKYLNPYVAAFATYDEHSMQLTVSVVCTVSGRVLAQATSPDKVLVSAEYPFSIAFGEHWFAYTYLALGNSQTTKLVVGELYESEEINERVSGTEVNVFEDTSVPVLKLAAWAVPRGEHVYSLATSVTRFGAVARELVLALESKLVTIPRAHISALRPVPRLEIDKNGFLSHIFGIHRARHLLTASSNLESTYLVAAYGGPDLFFTRSAPSGEIDRLHQQFPKFKLIALLGGLGFGVYTMAPLARMRMLADEWR